MGKLLKKSCCDYLAWEKDTRKDVALENVYVVRKFLDVFYEDLQSLPPRLSSILI